MLFPLGAGRTVTVIEQTISGATNPYGQDILTPTSTTYDGCVILFGASIEDDEARTTVTSACQVGFPSGTPISPLAEVRLDDGTLWAVDGQPAQQSSQLTGSTGRVWANLRRVTG